MMILGERVTLKRVLKWVLLSLISVIIGVVITSIYEPIGVEIRELVYGKPEILINIAVIQPLVSNNLTLIAPRMIFTSGDNGKIRGLYLTRKNDWETIVKSKNPIFIIADSEYEECKDCSYYHFSLKNIGKSEGKEIVMDWKLNEKQVILKGSSKMLSQTCDGSFEEEGCRYIFSNIGPSVADYFSLSINSKTYSQPTCLVDGKEDCFFKRIDIFRIQRIPVNKKDVLFQGEDITLPTSDGIWISDKKDLWINMTSKVSINPRA